MVTQRDFAAGGTERHGHSNPWVVLAVVLAGGFMQLVDVSIVNVAIPSIQGELHTTYAQIQLVLVLYSLGFAGTLITSARLGDIYGRRKTFLIGVTGFTGFSVLCAAAPTANVLVGARFAQGVFAGLMFAQILSVIQVTFPPQTRGKALGAFGAVIGVATILGPLLGGLLIKLNLFGLDWRLIFYVNVPIGVLTLFGALSQLGESRAPNAPRLDILGAILVTAGLVMLVYGVAVGREKGWPIWVDALMAAAVPILAAFVVYEIGKTRRNDSPLVIMTLFKERAFSIGMVLLFVFLLALPSYFFVFSLYIQIGEGFTPLAAGLAGFPFALASGFAAARSDAVAARLGNRVLVVGCALLVAGMLLVLGTAHLVGTRPHIYSFVVPLLISGAGLGFFIAPVINIVLAGIHVEGAGSASGVLSTVQQAGAAIGIALTGIVFFGAIGSGATNAAQGVTPRLRAALSAAGLPASAVGQSIAGFDRCFHDRATATDPTTNPASCQVAQRNAAQGQPQLRQVVGAAFRDAALQASARNFSAAFQRTLVYLAGIFLLALLLVLALPKVDPRALPTAAVADPGRPVRP